MTENQLIELKHAVAIINAAIAEQPPANSSWDCPVTAFARRFLVHNQPMEDLSCSELWCLYSQLVLMEKLPPMRKSVFLRRLPVVLATVLNIKKSHNIIRGGSRVRGFIGLVYRVDDSLPPPDL